MGKRKYATFEDLREDRVALYKQVEYLIEIVERLCGISRDVPVDEDDSKE